MIKDSMIKKKDQTGLISSVNITRLLEERKDLTHLQKEEILKDYSKGLSEEWLSVYFDSRFTFDQAREIVKAYESGLSEEEVEILKDPSLSPKQLGQLRESIKKLGINRIKPFIEMEYPFELLKVIITALSYGFTPEEIQTLIKPTTPVNEAKLKLYYYFARKHNEKLGTDTVKTVRKVAKFITKCTWMYDYTGVDRFTKSDFCVIMFFIFALGAFITGISCLEILESQIAREVYRAETLIDLIVKVIKDFPSHVAKEALLMLSLAGFILLSVWWAIIKFGFILYEIVKVDELAIDLGLDLKTQAQNCSVC